MAQNDRQKQQGNQHPIPIDQDTIKAWISNQTFELQNQKAENEIRIKEIEANARLSEKSLDIQKSVLENQGKDFRMTITRIAYIGGGILVVILLFIGFCLWNNKDAFAYKFCQGISYILTTVIGYFFGKSSHKKSSTQSNSQEQDQVF
jgi:hypothetical protein